MSIADRIAAKRRELAQFVTENAAAVIAEDMNEAMRGAAALDLLKLMVASGLSAQVGPTIDVTPAPVALVDENWQAPKIKMKFPPSQAHKHRERRALLGEEAVQQVVVEGITQAPKRQGMEKRFTDEMMAAALTAAKGNHHEAATALGCSGATLYAYRKRMGLTDAQTRVRRRPWSDAEIAAALQSVSGDRSAAAAKLGCFAGIIDRYRKENGIVIESGKGRWTNENVAKLRDIATRSPRPSIEAMAAEMGTTPAAIQTALSRADITRRDAPMADLSTFKKRDCMTCSKPFLSEGNHNRMCSACTSGRMECAA